MLYYFVAVACVLFLGSASAFYLTLFIQEVLAILRKPAVDNLYGQKVSEHYEEESRMSRSSIRIMIEKHEDSYTATAFDEIGHLASVSSSNRDKAVSKIVKRLTEIGHYISEETLTIEDMNS